MSVLAGKRRTSKFEPIVYSVELRYMLIDLMQRNFGVKDLEHFVRLRYAYGKDTVEDYAKYAYLMQNFKLRIERLAAHLTNSLRAANSVYPTSLHEYEQRREFQNNALVNCEQLIDELQRVVEIFDVDLNIYERYVNAIDREIGLIKNWRQSDNKIKLYLQGNS